ncbi:MAG: hypothetical protein Q7V20_19340 [Aquabacterium sp.]|nr:hypothetical protein [Aquabacterium sp.]MDO9005607.1 hypothetical protein [Aquabacterium sp.]
MTPSLQVGQAAGACLNPVDLQADLSSPLADKLRYKTLGGLAG